MFYSPSSPHFYTLSTSIFLRYDLHFYAKRFIFNKFRSLKKHQAWMQNVSPNQNVCLGSWLCVSASCMGFMMLLHTLWSVCSVHFWWGSQLDWIYFWTLFGFVQKRLQGFIDVKFIDPRNTYLIFKCLQLTKVYIILKSLIWDCGLKQPWELRFFFFSFSSSSFMSLPCFVSAAKAFCLHKYIYSLFDPLSPQVRNFPFLLPE